MFFTYLERLACSSPIVETTQHYGALSRRSQAMFFAEFSAESSRTMFGRTMFACAADKGGKKDRGALKNILRMLLAKEASVQGELVAFKKRWTREGSYEVAKKAKRNVSPTRLIDPFERK